MSAVKKSMNTKMPFLDADYHLWLLLSQTRSALFKARQNRVGKYIHHSMASALVTIWQFDGKTTPAQLSRWLFLEPHSVSELVIRMEKKGLITKKKDPKRENIVRISTTEKGRKFCLQAIQFEFVCNMIGTLSAEQKHQLETSLRILYRAALKEMGIAEFKYPHSPRKK
jgi:DNA-binding MarR family transcriptional regulator